MLEEIPADIVDDILTDLCHHRGAYFREYYADNYAQQHSQTAEKKLRDSFGAAHIVIYRVLNDKRGKQSDNNRNGAQRKRQRYPALVLSRVNQRAL